MKAQTLDVQAEMGPVLNQLLVDYQFIKCYIISQEFSTKVFFETNAVSANLVKCQPVLLVRAGT
jgi:hypothetical protein